MNDSMNYTTQLHFTKTADVVVVGGGPAGIAAAVAAARNGATTLLIEQHGCLGGMMTLGMVMPFSARSTRSGQHFGGIMEEMLQQTISMTRQYSGGSGKDHHIFSSPHVMKFVALDLALKSGVEVLFHAMLVGVEREGDLIKRLVVSTKSGLCAIEALFVIDATGDGDIIAGAGEEFVLGSEPGVMAGLTATGLNVVHEGGGHYGDYEEIGKMQPVTIMFTMGGVEVAKAKPLVNKKLNFSDLGISREEFLGLPYANTPGFMVEEASEEIPLPQGRVLFFQNRRPGEVVVNMTRITGVNGADALELSKGEVLAQQQMFYVIDFLKRYVPGFEDAYLLETGDVLGVRETRRLVGRYVLRGPEAVECVPFHDVIAHGSYIIDIHDPQGRKKAIGGEIHGDCYDIPYRCLVPKTIGNLLVAGRCISTDHVAHSSTRIQGTCMLTGQAAGTAAAMSIEEGCSPANLEVVELQNRLIAAGVQLRIPSRAVP